MLHFLKHETEITRSGLLCIFGQEYNFTLLLQGQINYPNFEDLAGGQGLGLCTSIAGGTGLSPGWRTKISLAVQCSQNIYFFNFKN